MDGDTIRVTVYYSDMDNPEDFDSLYGVELSSDQVIQIETEKFITYIPFFRIDKITEEKP